MSKKQQTARSAAQFPQLLVQDSLSMSVRRQRVFPERTVRLLITLLGSVGTLWAVQGFFHFPVDLRPMFLLIVGLTLMLRGLRTLWPKGGFVGILAVFAVIPVVLFKYRRAAVVGISAIYNIMRKTILWQQIFDDSTVHVGRFSEADCVRFVIDIIIVATVALLEYSDVLLMHPQSSLSGFWIRLLVTFPFLESGLYFGLETSSVAVFMMVLFWLGTLAVCRKKSPGRISESSFQIQSAFARDNEQKYATHEPGAGLLLLLCGVLASGVLIGCRTYVRSEELNQKRDALRSWYRNLTFQDFAELFEDIPTPFGINTVTDEVDLVAENGPQFTGKPVLHIDMNQSAVPDDYYLRGMVRAEYTGRGWAIPNSAYRNHQKLFRKLTEANRMPQTIFISDHADELRTEADKFPVVRAHVSALTPQVINYLPYQSIYEIGTKYRYDIETELKSTQDYEFWLLTNGSPNWGVFSDNTAPSPDPLVHEYEEFVHEQYLRLPETESMERIREQFAPLIPDESAPLDMRLAAIQSAIWANAEYTTSPGATPGDRDYVEYFLLENHKGYCAHYASAAVLLCRMAGIPARYCQGYVLTTSDFAFGYSSEGYHMNVPDDQAHAWAEIYVDGYGWQPYEFTETVLEQWHAKAMEIPAETTVTVPAVTTTTMTTTGAGGTTTASDANMQTTAPGAGGTDETVPGQPAIDPVVLRRIIGTVMILLALIGAVLLYIRYHKYVLRKRLAAFSDKDPNRAANAGYEFLIRLLKLYGIEQGTMTHEDFAAYAEENCKLLPKGWISAVIMIQQAAVFSREGVPKQDAKRVCVTAIKLSKAMYQEAKPPRKFLLKWFRHII